MGNTMNRKYTHGNAAELVIIGVLVLAVAGLLVWKFVGGKDTTSDTSSANTTTGNSSKTNDASASTIALVDGSIDSSFGTTLSFKYPATWKYAQTMDGTIETDGSWTQKITVTSPSGKYVVQYYVGAGGGLGGSCEPPETGTIASAAYQVVSGFSGMSYIEMTFQDMPSVATNRIGAIELIDTKSAASVKSGSSVCDVYLHNVVKLAEEKYVQLIDASMTVTDATTASQLKSALTGNEYEQGKAILLSTKH
jgi:hypothetical protein